MAAQAGEVNIPGNLERMLARRIPTPRLPKWPNDGRSQTRDRQPIQGGTAVQETTRSVSSERGDDASSMGTAIRSHRSPKLIGLGIAIIALGGLGAAWLYSAVSSSVSVIAVHSNVNRGEVIQESDLTTASISLDPSLDPVAAVDLPEVVGQRAAYDLPAGSLVTQGALTDESMPTPGYSIVPVAVPATRLPSYDLRAGSVVKVVDTPREGDEPPSGTPHAQLATVLSVDFDDESGQSVVRLNVAQDVAADLAARAATGRVILVLESGGAK